MKTSLPVMFTVLLVLHITVSVNSGLITKLLNRRKHKVNFDMAPNSVDDTYGHCADKMLENVTNLLSDEKKKDANFSKAWGFAENNKHTDNYPSQQHSIAIYTYTLGNITTPPFHQTFNNAVRTWQSHTLANFPYKSEHFLLTDAIWKLKEKEIMEKKPRCVTTYRGTSMKYKKAKNGTEFRFGAFTSGSIHKTVALGFGNKTCFIIRTCFGANITPYSAYKGEVEVLIPPYEKFKVTDIFRKGKGDMRECKVTYKVESSGIQSNHVCSWVDNGSV